MTTAALQQPELAIIDLLQAIAKQVDQRLEAALDRSELPENLRAAVKYGVLGGGKRLRPALTVLCCEVVGGVRQAAMDAACAMELIHCFSLVHDDLPAMDDDDLRRGRPTLHVHAGEAMAILAGDAMVSLAFEMVAASPGNDSQRTALVRELAASTTAMIAGQVYDTLGGFTNESDNVRRLNIIHRNKTGALIRAACRMGAICGGAKPGELENLSRYGERLGLMFQIVDDVLDVTQSSEHLGKRAGKDQDAGKLTFPGVLGLEESRREVQKLHEAASAAIADFGPRNRHLVDVCDALAVRTR